MHIVKLFLQSSPRPRLGPSYSSASSCPWRVGSTFYPSSASNAPIGRVSFFRLDNLFSATISQNRVAMRYATTTFQVSFHFQQWTLEQRWVKEVPFSIPELNLLKEQGRSSYNPNDCSFLHKKSILARSTSFKGAQHLSMGELRT